MKLCTAAVIVLCVVVALYAALVAWWVAVGPLLMSEGASEDGQGDRTSRYLDGTDTPDLAQGDSIYLFMHIPEPTDSLHWPQLLRYVADSSYTWILIEPAGDGEPVGMMLTAGATLTLFPEHRQGLFTKRLGKGGIVP